MKTLVEKLLPEDDEIKVSKFCFQRSVDLKSQLTQPLSIGYAIAYRQTKK